MKGETYLSLTDIKLNTVAYSSFFFSHQLLRSPHLKLYARERHGYLKQRNLHFSLLATRWENAEVEGWLGNRVEGGSEEDGWIRVCRGGWVIKWGGKQSVCMCVCVCVCKTGRAGREVSETTEEMQGAEERSFIIKKNGINLMECFFKFFAPKRGNTPTKISLKGVLPLSRSTLHTEPCFIHT